MFSIPGSQIQKIGSKMLDFVISMFEHFRCWLGCCLIPFCIQDLQDVKHICPNCSKVVGVYRRIWYRDLGCWWCLVNYLFTNKIAMPFSMAYFHWTLVKLIMCPYTHNISVCFMCNHCNVLKISCSWRDLWFSIVNIMLYDIISSWFTIINATLAPSMLCYMNAVAFKEVNTACFICVKTFH